MSGRGRVGSGGRGGGGEWVGRVRAALPVLVSVSLASACGLPRWPVSGPLTSPFGLRLDGIWPEIHRGVDISVPEGTPVRAMKGGRVRFAGEMRGYGLVVIMDHGPNLSTVYAHLSELRVATGDEVKGREVIGLAGRTGNATGSHLHFEVWWWGRPEDPVPLLGGPP